MVERRTILALPLGLGVAPAASGQKTPPLSERISVFGMDWDVISTADWKIEKAGGVETLHLVTARPQETNPRRPIQFALAQTELISRFTLELEVRRQSKKGSLIAVYAWRDESHFNYLHLSDDAAAKVNVHNGIFHCYGGDRVRISAVEGPESIASDDWHKVRLTYDATKGLAEAWVNGTTSPSLKGIDLSLGAGRIGLGSFFNTASFRNFNLRRQA